MGSALSVLLAAKVRDFRFNALVDMDVVTWWSSSCHGDCDAKVTRDIPEYCAQIPFYCLCLCLVSAQIAVEWVCGCCVRLSILLNERRLRLPCSS